MPARFWLGYTIVLALALSPPAWAQHDHHTTPRDSTRTPEAPKSSTQPKVPTKRATASGHAYPPMNGMRDRMATTSHRGAMPMSGLYGPYSAAREASGTSWQPDRATHRGIQGMKGPWMLMAHGAAELTHNDQGGRRGDEMAFVSNMLMGMAQRRMGPGTLGLRTMFSLEPATIGKEGYPLLLQSGETANGSTGLIDRQHPHDLFMELAASYSVSRGNRSAFVYAGLPGEPALGPPAFMHRFSGAAIPAAPITHHWLDSSHITFGVLTAGMVLGRAKLEASAFRGREPDENRYDIESPKLDSHAFRLSVNPNSSWSLQASRGRLNSPEQLEPEVDTDRTTASAIYAADWGSGHWETTVTWGRNRSRPGPTLDGIGLESAVRFREKHTLFARIERVEKNELFPEGDPRDGLIFDVGNVAAGYRFDFWRSGNVALGVGAWGSISVVPNEIQGVYGDNPASGMLFARAELR